MEQQNDQRSSGGFGAEKRPEGQSASQILEHAKDEATAVARDTASSIKDQMQTALDGQVESGAAYIGHAASSVRTASADLSNNAPMLANLAEAAADKLDEYANGLKGKSVDELWSEATSFARRQPALVFGLAAVAGFLTYRTLKSSGSLPAKPVGGAAEEFHGA